MPNVFIDVETTGFGHTARPPREDAVIQVGLAWRDSENNVRTWSRYCNPGLRYFENGRAFSALKVNGITQDVLASAPGVDAVAGDFWKTVYGLEASGDMARFFSYNVAFDAPFLPAKPRNVTAHRFGEGVMLKAQDFLDYHKWPKLEEAVRVLGLMWPPGRAHDAAVDAHAALLIHERIDSGSLSREIPVNTA